jgi:hypothetical protein
MKKIFTIAFLAASFIACDSPATGGQHSDSTDKTTLDTSMMKAATPSQTDTTLPRPGDSAKDMIDTAKTNVKLEMK